MKCATSSYWQQGTDECIKQEFKGGLGNLYSLELSLAQPIRIPIQVDMRDMHILYVMQAGKAIALHTAHNGTLCPIAPERARHLYLPPESYEIELPAGSSHIFGFYYKRFLFRDGNDRSFSFMRELIEADRKQLGTPLYSPDFAIGPRTRIIIRKLCQELRRGKLSNESFIFEQITKLIELSAEKVRLELNISPLSSKEKVDEARRYIQNFIANDLGVPSMSMVADSLAIHPNRLNALHRYYYKESIFKFRNEQVLLKSKELLLDGDSITQIAYMLEYSSPSTFIRFFKQQTGQTPKSWLTGQQIRP